MEAVTNNRQAWGFAWCGARGEPKQGGIRNGQEHLPAHQDRRWSHDRGAGAGWQLQLRQPEHQLPELPGSSDSERLARDRSPRVRSRPHVRGGTRRSYEAEPGSARLRGRTILRGRAFRGSERAARGLFSRALARPGRLPARPLSVERCRLPRAQSQLVRRQVASLLPLRVRPQVGPGVLGSLKFWDSLNPWAIQHLHGHRAGVSIFIKFF